MHASIDETKRAALEVLRANAAGPFGGLPRTAGWGYPEPYTRDLLLCAPGVFVSGDRALLASLRRVLATLAENQSRRGQITSLVHDRDDRGASDTTPLFLWALGAFRRVAGEPAFLTKPAWRALRWMSYQSIEDRSLVGQQPTSDWRDEQWVLGNGLYVNTLVLAYLNVLGMREQAAALRADANRADGRGFVTEGQPVYALWFYKVLRGTRCDLLGNSLAILTGMADRERAGAMVDWIEAACVELRGRGDLAVDLPPCLFPYIEATDWDWHPRYASYNPPGHYHNGGVWPFVCGLYVAALVAAGRRELAAAKLQALTGLVQQVNDNERGQPGGMGFNEWFRARDGRAAGQNWQSWSAAMYLYAAHCVESGRAGYFQPE